MASIKLRTANITPNINHLALLRHWDKQPLVIECGIDGDDWGWETELEKYPAWRDFLISELDARPIGFMQIIDPQLEKSHYWGAGVEPNLRAIDIWIGEKDELNKGYGTEMMRQAIEKCFAPPEVKAIIIDPLASNTNAHRFYERLGFKFIGQRQFGEDDCFVYRLARADWIAGNNVN